MGQHKFNKRAALHAAATEITRKLIDEGRLIEAGAQLHCDFLKVSPALRDTVVLAFMSGAEHTFSSIMNMMDEDREPTDADMRRMDAIHKELEAWRGKLSEAVDPAQGRA